MTAIVEMLLLYFVRRLSKFVCIVLFCCCLLVSVLNDQWCWKSKTLDIEVIDKDIKNIEFSQTGFMLSASLSHSIMLVSSNGLVCLTVSCWSAVMVLSAVCLVVSCWLIVMV